VNALKRLYVILFYTSLLIFRSVAYSGFTNGVLGLKQGVLKGYILRDSNRSFQFLEQTAVLFLKSRTMLFFDSLTDYRWFERLHRDGIIRGAYVRDGITSFTVGTPFIPRFDLNSGFYIDKGGGVHYTVADEKKDVFIDAMLDTAALQADVMNFSKIPDWLILYDQREGLYSVISQRNAEKSPDIDVGPLSAGYSPLEVNMRSVRYTGTVVLENGNFLLLAQYPIGFGENAVFLIGLIIIVLLTILLLSLIIRFVFSVIKESAVKRFEGGKKEKSIDVVNQIDRVLVVTRELSEGEGLPEKMKVMIPERKSDQMLIHDGIRIKKPRKGGES